MARRQASIRDMVVTALQDFTQKQLAAQLGVSERTIRRWKNEGVEPASDFTRYAVTDEYKRVRRSVQRSNARIGAPSLPIPVALEANRRTVAVRDREGNDTGKRKPSEWVNYDMSRMGPDDVFDALRAVADRAGPEGVSIQLIYQVPRSPQYPRGRSGTVPIEIHSDMEDEELLTETLGSISFSKVLYIGVVW